MLNLNCISPGRAMPVKWTRTPLLHQVARPATMLFRKRGSVRIDDSEQETTDFDWFVADELGYLAHFATAGFKHLPASVTRSAEDLAVVTGYFQNRAPVFNGYRVNPDIGRHRSDWKGEPGEARYLSSFVEMAASRPDDSLLLRCDPNSPSVFRGSAPRGLRDSRAHDPEGSAP